MMPDVNIDDNRKKVGLEKLLSLVNRVRDIVPSERPLDTLTDHGIPRRSSRVEGLYWVKPSSSGRSSRYRTSVLPSGAQHGRDIVERIYSVLREEGSAAWNAEVAGNSGHCPSSRVGHSRPGHHRLMITRKEPSHSLLLCCEHSWQTRPIEQTVGGQGARSTA